MQCIEQRAEGPFSAPDYSGRVLTAEEIADGRHRRWVGSHFDDGHGKGQVDYLVTQGLAPGHRLLDIGCGSFRAGRYFIDYLDSGNYYGIDANHSVMQAGYDHELSEIQLAKLPIQNLRANDRFNSDFGVSFDMAIAQSVFTHVSLNHIRLCLYRVAKAMEPGGKFFATFNEQRPGQAVDYFKESGRAKARFYERDVFWYYRSDIQWAASFYPWKFRYIGDWGHLGGQHMVEFTRLEGQASEPPVEPAPKMPTQPLPRFVFRARRWTARHIAPH